MRRKVITVFLYLILCFAFPISLYAEEIASSQSGLDITFAIDCSGSMKTNDPDRIGMGMVQAFIDTVHTEDIRIGYVAYHDKIVSSSAPVSISNIEERRELKDSINRIGYSGDTDIGLGLTCAYDLMSGNNEHKRIIVLISDGETDLKGQNGRTIEQSNQDLARCLEKCKAEGIQIYTIAFGAYEGNQRTLEHLASETGAESYSVESPQNLIEVLYGIFDHNLSYKIQQLSSGIYAGGRQEIRCFLDEPYLDEMDVLIISNGGIGETTLQYGEQQIPMTNLSNYAVGKIKGDEIDDAVKEMTVYASTTERQNLYIYLLSYREMTPVLDMDTAVPKNKDISYNVYFKDKSGTVIRDEGFYKKFKWELQSVDQDHVSDLDIPVPVEISDGVVHGTVNFKKSGSYELHGMLTDNLGSYSFGFQVSVTNTMPAGSLPVTKCTVLDQEISYNLNEFFSDKEGDTLQFHAVQEPDGPASIQLADQVLTIFPEKSGTQMVTLTVDDGESAFSYMHQITIVPLWQEYWWAILLLCAAAAGILWKLFHKPKPELDVIEEEKKNNRFHGKLDLYFTGQPDTDEEIPPLTFQMHKVKDSKVTLGSLLREYPEAADALGLDDIHLIADEERRMVLYHTSAASIMLGNSIVCRQIQYSVSFGDIIYIVSQDEAYELEVHYIAMIQ